VTRKLPLACAMAAAALFAAAAVAQDVAQRPFTKSDLAGWSGDPDTLTRMISRIETDTGGRVIEIRYTTRDGPPGYHAAVSKGGRVTFLRVAAQNGESAELSAASLPDWMLKWKARADVNQAMRATVPLTQAIRTAEQASDGAPAVAAGIATSASNPTSDVQAYNVLIYRQGDVRRVSVDDKTGQIISDPRALADWP
jgi:uncharacterized membrane protein YkoI